MTRRRKVLNNLGIIRVRDYILKGLMSRRRKGLMTAIRMDYLTQI